MSGQLHAPAALPPGKSSRYPLYRRLGGPQRRSGRYGEEIILDSTGTWNPNLSVVQPVASRYTDCAIPAHPDTIKREEKVYCFLNYRCYIIILVMSELIRLISKPIKRKPEN
jgi:hypothetical protein